MENNNKRPGRFHRVIETQYVFSENDQVFLYTPKARQDTSTLCGSERLPIHLNWIPIN